MTEPWKGLRIVHSHAEGTLLLGTARGDGTNLIVKGTADGWRFSRTLECWYQPRSRDRDADPALIGRLATALRNAGHEVHIQIDNQPRPTEQVETDRATRAATRIDRYENLATAHHQQGSTRLRRVRQIRDGYPLGQPVKDARDQRRREKLNAAEDAAHAELAAGQHWQQRAAAAAGQQRYRHNPRVITRRLDRLEAVRRSWARRAETATGDYQQRVETAIERLDQEITYWRDVLEQRTAAAGQRLWTAADFRTGDEALILGTWYPVLRVNPKSLTVPPLILLGQQRTLPDGKEWTDRAPYDKVYGRRRNGHILTSPPPPPDAKCGWQPEAEDRDEPQAPCPGRPIMRIIINHDGQTCGCDDTCLGPDGPWQEIHLLCETHATRHIGNDQPSKMAIEYLDPSA